MAHSSAAFQQALSQTPFETPHVPIIGNVTLHRCGLVKIFKLNFMRS